MLLPRYKKTYLNLPQIPLLGNQNLRMLHLKHIVCKSTAVFFFFVKMKRGNASRRAKAAHMFSLLAHFSLCTL